MSSWGLGELSGAHHTSEPAGPPPPALNLPSLNCSVWILVSCTPEENWECVGNNETERGAEALMLQVKVPKSISLKAVFSHKDTNV